jgi:hypothetical protein
MLYLWIVVKMLPLLEFVPASNFHFRFAPQSAFGRVCAGFNKIVAVRRIWLRIDERTIGGMLLLLGDIIVRRGFCLFRRWVLISFAERLDELPELESGVADFAYGRRLYQL